MTTFTDVWTDQINRAEAGFVAGNGNPAEALAALRQVKRLAVERAIEAQRVGIHLLSDSCWCVPTVKPA